MGPIIRHNGETLLEAICDPDDRVIETGGHPYTLHPFQAVFPQDTRLIAETAERIVQDPRFETDFDYVFALAQKSIPFATLIALKAGKDLLVAYSRSYDSPNQEMRQTEIEIIEPKKYADPFVLHSYYLHEGDIVTFVGDDINWGDATVETALAFAAHGIHIANFVIGVEKRDRGGIERLESVLDQSDLFPDAPIHIGASVSIVGDKMVPSP